MNSFTVIFHGFYPDFKNAALSTPPPLPCYPHVLTQAPLPSDIEESPLGAASMFSTPMKNPVCFTTQREAGN